VHDGFACPLHLQSLMENKKKNSQRKAPIKGATFGSWGNNSPLPPRRRCLKPKPADSFFSGAAAAAKKNPHKVPPQNPQRLAHKGQGKCSSAKHATATAAPLPSPRPLRRL